MGEDMAVLSMSIWFLGYVLSVRAATKHDGVCISTPSFEGGKKTWMQISWTFIRGQRRAHPCFVRPALGAPHCSISPDFAEGFA